MDISVILSLYCPFRPFYGPLNVHQVHNVHIVHSVTQFCPLIYEY